MKNNTLFDKFFIPFSLFAILLNACFFGLIWYAFSHDLQQSAIIGAVAAFVIGIYLTYRKRR